MGLVLHHPPTQTISKKYYIASLSKCSFENICATYMKALIEQPNETLTWVNQWHIRSTTTKYALVNCGSMWCHKQGYMFIELLPDSVAYFGKYKRECRGQFFKAASCQEFQNAICDTSAGQDGFHSIHIKLIAHSIWHVFTHQPNIWNWDFPGSIKKCQANSCF